MSNLRELLFERRAPDGRSLFPSALKLCEAIGRIDRADNPYRGKAQSTATTLSAAIRGYGRARISDDLRQLILEVVRVRLREWPELAMPWLVEIEESVLRLRPTRIRSASKPSETVEALLSGIWQAKELLMVSPNLNLPEPLIPPQLREVLIAKLGLSSTDQSTHMWQGDATPESRLILVTDSAQVATQEWDSLYREITGLSREGLNRLDPETAAFRLQQLSDTGKLQVIIAPSDHCAIPLIAIDPLKWESCRLFCIPCEDTVVSAYKLPVAYVRSWRRAFYDPLVLQKDEYKTHICWHEANPDYLVSLAKSILER